MIEIWERLVLALCIFGPVVLLAGLGAVALWRRGTSAARRSWGRVAFAAALALPAIYLGATKPISGRVTVDDDYIQDAGSYLTNDVAHVAIEKKSALLPDDTEILVYARLLSQSNATDWVRLEPRLTFADHPHDYALPYATNYNVIVAAAYTPSPTVHTNGVWVVRGFEIPDREGTFAFGNSKIAQREARDYPYKYQVEYLESTGTQYIDTGIVPTSTSGFSIDFIPKVTGGTSVVCGSRTGGTDTRFWMNPSVSYIAIGFGIFYEYYNTVPSQVGVRYSVTVNFQNSRVTTCGDYSIALGTFSGNPYSVYLFCANVSGTPTFLDTSMTKIYGMKMSEGSTLVRDYIPVVDWNDVPAMFDRVTQTFFYNQGTGSFTAGPRID